MRKYFISYSVLSKDKGNYSIGNIILDVNLFVYAEILAYIRKANGLEHDAYVFITFYKEMESYES